MATIGTRMRWVLAAVALLAAPAARAHGPGVPPREVPVRASGQDPPSSLTGSGSALDFSPRERPPASQEDLKLRFSGQYLEYDQARRVAIIRDGAFVQQGGLRLWADTVQGDLASHQLAAEGNVVFWRREERFKADSITYNTRTHRGRATNVSTRRGPTYLKARRLVMEPYRMLGYQVWTTTDDRDPPSYRVEAKRMVMIPRKRIVFRNAALKVGEKTYFRMPTYMINIANPEAVNRFFINPAYNPGKGFNLRSYWDYYLSEAAYGRLYFNPSQFEGTDLGASLAYRLAHASTGQFQFTRFRSNVIAQEHDRHTLKHDQVFSTSSSGTLDLVLTKNEFFSGGTERKLTIGAGVNKAFEDWQTNLSYDRLVNLDSGLAPGRDIVQFASVTPRFTANQLRSHRVLGTSLSMRSDATIARINERTLGREVDATKGEAVFSFAPRPLEIGDVSRINTNFRQAEALYSTGDLRSFFSFWVNTHERWTRHFSTAFDYVYEDVGGQTPFVAYDRLVPSRNTLTTYLRAANERWFNATLFQTQFDFANHDFRNASSNLTFRSPSIQERSWALSLTPVYEFSDPHRFATLRFQTVSANLRYANPDRWAHNLIANYDQRNRRLASVSNYSDFLLAPTLRAEVQSNLSFNTLERAYDLTKLNLAITKDLRAFEARLKWNTIQREVFLEFYLKFASGKRVAVGVNYDRNVELVTPDRARGWF